MSAKLWTTMRAEKRPIHSASENQFAFRSSRDSSFVITIGRGDTILRRRRAARVLCPAADSREEPRNVTTALVFRLPGLPPR